MKQIFSKFHLAWFALFLFPTFACFSQVVSGSDGSDGAFNPTTNTVINMANRPSGIYHYASINIPAGVRISFIPNTNNTPVIWLVQGNCTISGTVDVSGPDINFNNIAAGGIGGPGGFRGGNAGGPGASPGDGLGIGGGKAAVSGASTVGGNASFGALGQKNGADQADPGQTYGNIYMTPMIGGSGGGGGYNGYGGLGGGGAILIAVSGTILLNGQIVATANGDLSYGNVGCGSGGAIRLVATSIQGGGTLWARGRMGGDGRIRLDALDNTFVGLSFGQLTRGFQPVVLTPSGQSVQLNVISIGGVAVAASPTGKVTTPDAVISGQQVNPIPVVVRCSNLPLNTPITVTIKPANGPTVSAIGYNNSGTQTSSTATVSLNMPRGGGFVYATATVGN